MTPKGQLWNNRRAWGTAQDIERLQRAASGNREPGPYAESVKAFRQAIQDAALGIAWWNGMTRQHRAEALRAADSACPAEAWEHWRQTAAGFKCEEEAHG